MLRQELLLNRFRQYMEARGFSDRTIPDYLHHVQVFLDYLTEIGISKIQEVDRQTLADYQVQLLAQKFRDQPISQETRARRLITLRTFFRFLVRIGAIDQDPTIDLELPKCAKTLPRNILTKKEMGKLLATPDLDNPLGVRDRAILEVFYSTGVRVSELCSLTIYDVDTTRGELRIALPFLIVSLWHILYPPPQKSTLELRFANYEDTWTSKGFRSIGGHKIIKFVSLKNNSFPGDYMFIELKTSALKSVYSESDSSISFLTAKMMSLILNPYSIVIMQWLKLG